MSALRTVRISETRTLRFAEKGECNAEIDNHADTTVMGRDSLVVGDYEQPVNVVGWNPESQSQEFKTVSAAVMYIHPQTMQRYILVFHQAIHHPDLKHHLICPMQLRVNGVKVNETPKHLEENATEATFALQATAKDLEEELTIPFNLQGVTAYFPVCKPSQEEYEDASIPKIDMTWEDLPWNPNDPSFMESEEAMVDYNGRVVSGASSRGQNQRVISAVNSNFQANEEAHNSVYRLSSIVCFRQLGMCEGSQVSSSPKLNRPDAIGQEMEDPI